MSTVHVGKKINKHLRFYSIQHVQFKMQYIETWNPSKIKGE